MPAREDEAQPIVVPPDAPWLGEFAATMESHRCADRHGTVTCGDGVYTCDGGALLGALVAQGTPLQPVLEVGLYWHTDAALRAELMGEDDDEETLAWVSVRAMDEHHHWVVLTGPQGQRWLFDPNGPVRAEPYFQPWTDDVQKRYVPLPATDPWRRAALDPDEHWDPQLQEYYPASFAWLLRHRSGQS